MGDRLAGLPEEVKILFQSFDVFAAAPNGVKKLRELILQLAVQGKLVPQDPNDEPASELLKKIKAEKTKLVAEGKIKKPKPLPPIKPDEVPFELPEGWGWVRMGECGTFINGDRSKNYPQRSAYVERGIPFVNAGHMTEGRVDFGEMNFITQDVFDRLKSGKTSQGDILFCLRGSLGKVAYVDYSGPSAIASSLVIVRAAQRELPTYLMHYFSSPLASTMVRRHDNGSAQPNLAANSLRLFLLPLPPLPEQHRIVDKVDQLMSLCDDLEARYNAQQDERQKLNAAALDTLLAAQNQAEFDTAWQRVCDTFDLLYDAPESVAKLRQAILQLAVMGKLVAGRAVQPTIGLGDKKHGVKVGDFVKFQNGYAFKSSWFTSKGIRLARNQNVGHGVLQWDKTVCIEPSRAKEFDRFALAEGDIIISLDRPVINTGIKIARVCHTDLPCLLLQRVGRAQFVNDHVMPEFFFAWLESTEFRTAINPGRSKGVPHISTKQIESIPFVPPPIEVQKRTVQVLNRLRPVCDDLEAKLTGARERAESLVGAVVGQF